MYPGTLALARAHLDAGQRVWLVSAAPVELATIIAKRLGLTGALGTVSEIERGVYTGRLVGTPLHGPAKAEAVRALAEREGLDLSRCAAYSDSANDIPMLSLVGYPCAVNPDAKLRRHARDLGWRVVDYRTGRKAAMIGVPRAVAGDRGRRHRRPSTAVAVALDRRRRARCAPICDCRRKERRRSASARGQKKTLRRCMSSWYSVCWMVSRTWSVRLNTSIGSSAAPAG